MATWVTQYCGLLVVSLMCFVSGSVISDSYSEHLTHRGVRAAGCHLNDGRTMRNGENFTRLDTGPCVIYQCSNGDVLPLEYKCLRDGKCFPLKDVYKLGCIERTCSLVNGRFDYVVTREACTGYNASTCVDVGTTARNGCFGYRCDKVSESPFSVSYHLKQVDMGCELDGKCIPVNHNVTKRCRTMQCQKRFMSVGFFTVGNGCDIDGQCVDINGSREIDCRTFTCKHETVNGFSVLSVKPTKIRCKDADDVCNDPGEWFPLLMDDKVRVNCTCSVAPTNAVSISCPSIGFGGGSPAGTLNLPGN